MPDSVDFKLLAEPFKRFVDDRSRRMDRAAMWALRSAAREGVRAARRATPVLKQQGVESHRQLQRRRRQGHDVPGLLRASIRPSRNIKHIGPHAYEMTFGPRGARVHLYAEKIERKAGYMAQGYAAAEAAIEVNAIQAIAKVWRE
jgi:hypothetical protein